MKLFYFQRHFLTFVAFFRMESERAQKKLPPEHFDTVFRQQSTLFMPVLRRVLYLILNF